MQFGNETVHLLGMQSGNETVHLLGIQFGNETVHLLGMQFENETVHLLRRQERGGSNEPNKLSLDLPLDCSLTWRREVGPSYHSR